MAPLLRRMIVSQNEIASLCVKAARGAGLPLGDAEDLGPVGVLLAQRGQLDDLARALQAPLHRVPPQNGVIASANAVAVGQMALDLCRAGEGPIVFTQLAHIAVMQALADLSPCAVSLQQTPAGYELRLEEPNQAQLPPTTPGPIDVPDAIHNDLRTLAARTFVPATEASRLAGAGAGLTDND